MLILSTENVGQEKESSSVLTVLHDNHVFVSALTKLRRKKLH